MNILYFAEGLSVAMAQRLQDEGNNVTVVSADKDPYHVGMLKPAIDPKNWKSHLKNIDLIVNPDVKMIEDPDHELFTLGIPVVSGNKFFNRLENDRVFGKDVFKKVGLTVSDCITFKDFKEAIKFIKTNPAKWVFKANGQASRTLGYVGKQEDGSDVIERMAFYDSHMKKNKDVWDKELGVDFVLERCVDGIEVACGAYWDGQDFRGINLNWEHKRLGVGNVGIATGEMGTAIRATGPDTRFYMGTLEKLKPLLRQFPYRCYVDLNCIVNRENAYVLEITARFGWPTEGALNTMGSLSESKKLLLLSKGELHKIPENKFFKHDCGIIVVVGTFGIPYEKAYEEFGAQQPFKIPEEYKNNIYFDDVDKINNHYQTSKTGEGWVLDVATGSSSIDTAREKAFDIIKKIDLPGIYYRIDIGEKAVEDYRQMQKWKWV